LALAGLQGARGEGFPKQQWSRAMAVDGVKPAKV
jgi:hypothetical protein